MIHIWIQLRYRQAGTFYLAMHRSRDGYKYRVVSVHTLSLWLLSAINWIYNDINLQYTTFDE